MTTFRWIETIETHKTEVYELEVVTCESQKTTYPIRTSSQIIGIYSTLELAEADMQRSIVANADSPDYGDSCNRESIHHFIIQTRPLDVAHYVNRFVKDGCERRVYDDLGKFYGICLPDNKPFSGKRPDECKYIVGELVEVEEHGQLRPGIISALPVTPEIAGKLYGADQTDNVYCIEFNAKDRSHDHLPECCLFRPRFKINNLTKARFLRIYKQLGLPHAGD